MLHLDNELLNFGMVSAQPEPWTFHSINFPLYFRKAREQLLYGVISLKIQNAWTKGDIRGTTHLPNP